jgi:hypothetical protein
LTQENAKTANEPANILNFVMKHSSQANHYRVESNGNRTVTKLRLVSISEEMQTYQGRQISAQDRGNAARHHQRSRGTEGQAQMARRREGEGIFDQVS